MRPPWEIDNFLTVSSGRLHVDGVDTVELAREHETPLFVFSENRIRHNIERLRAAGGSIGCPLKLCYAGKAMSTVGILKAIRDAGCDIEVNSGGELWKAREAGFTGDQIIFNGTSKEVWEIEAAINAGIYAIQVDSIYELELISDTAARLGGHANVSLRLVPEIESGTHSGLQTALLTSKFGMMPNEAYTAFRDHASNTHLNLRGIHLHVGSQNPDPEVYVQALQALFAGVVEIYRDSGVKLSHVNLGGGFPVNYLHGAGQAFAEDDPRSRMLEAGWEPSGALSHAWTEAYGTLKDSGDQSLLENLTILLEPGRSIIADAGVCLTTVRNVKSRPVARAHSSSVTGETEILEGEGGIGVGSATASGQTTDDWLLTDAGFNILLSMETYKWYYHLISAERAEAVHNLDYKVAGPLCDGGDVYFDIEGEGRLPDHRRLPEDVKPGEVLALLNCGAYSLAQASQYNGRFLPPVILIRANGEPQLIRRRDNFQDLIASDIY
jgi:diaminopimelate decarboxylase